MKKMVQRRVLLGTSMILIEATFKTSPLVSNSSTTLSNMHGRSLRESLGKLFLWRDIFRNGRLERVLEESDELKETIVGLLVRIREFVTLRTSTTSPIPTAN